MSGRARIALIGAVGGAGVLVLIWLLAFQTHAGAQADQSVFVGFADLQRPHVNWLADLIAGVCDPAPFLVLSAIAVAIAFARGRARLALPVAAILLGANLTTELLKPSLALMHPHWMVPAGIPVHPDSWPSGHATAAMSLTLALVLAAPARRRPLVAALGAVFVVAVCYSFLTLSWHYPSDVLGGYLVAVMWTQLALAGMFGLDARRAGRLLDGAGPALSLRAVLTPPASRCSRRLCSPRSSGSRIPTPWLRFCTSTRRSCSARRRSARSRWRSQPHWCSGCGLVPILEDQRHRSIVDQLDLHQRPEYPLLGAQPPQNRS